MHGEYKYHFSIKTVGKPAFVQEQSADIFGVSAELDLKW